MEKLTKKTKKSQNVFSQWHLSFESKYAKTQCPFLVCLTVNEILNIAPLKTNSTFCTNNKKKSSSDFTTQSCEVDTLLFLCSRQNPKKVNTETQKHFSWEFQ